MLNQNVERTTESLDNSSDELNESLILKKDNPVGVLRIHRSIWNVTHANHPGRIATKTRIVSVLDYIEIYAYSALLMSFAYIIALAVICMAYGR
jgi:hypothetical protein